MKSAWQLKMLLGTATVAVGGVKVVGVGVEVWAAVQVVVDLLFHLLMDLQKVTTEPVSLPTQTKPKSTIGQLYCLTVRTFVSQSNL